MAASFLFSVRNNDAETEGYRNSYNNSDQPRRASRKHLISPESNHNNSTSKSSSYGEEILGLRADAVASLATMTTKVPSVSEKTSPKSNCCHHCMQGDRSEVSNSTYWAIELKAFCREVSIVGMRQIIRPSTSNLRAIFWSLLLLGGVGFTLYQFQDRINYYLSWPTNVAVSVEYVDEMRFPTVTICNENRVSRRVAVAYGELDIIEAIFPPFPMPTFQPDFTAYDIVQKRMNLDWNTIYINSAQPLSEAIFTCSYNSQPCNVNSDFVMIATDFGFCHTFNSATSNRTSKSTGSSSGLQTILFVNQGDYLVANSYSAGFRILLQAPNETPLVGQLAFKISPGVTTQVAVTTDVIGELPPPYGTCNNSANYTQSACLSQCQADYIVKQCKCKDISMPGSITVCNPKTYYQCVFPSQKKFITENVIATCDCHRQCEKLSYSYVVTQSEFSEYMIANIATTWNLNISDAEWRRNYAAIEVYFSELKYTYTNSTAAYSMLALLCDVGGALGLVLGSTVLTFFEVADLIVSLVVTHIDRTMKKRAATKRRMRAMKPVVNEAVNEVTIQDIE